MIERNYYCLVAGLPDLVADDKKLAFTSVQFRDMLHDGLHPDDFVLAQLFFLPYDHKNLLNLMFGKNSEWDERGNFSREMLEQFTDRKAFELSDASALPSYIVDFLNQFYGEEGLANYFKADMLLTTGYFDHLASNKNKFVSEIAQYDRTIGNIMNALNGRKYELQYEENLVGIDAITEALAKSRARDFGLSSEVHDIDALIQIFETENLLDREFKLDLYRWNNLDEMTFFNYFSIERILAFLLKLLIVERWYHLDKEKGQLMFNKILKDIESEFQFPEEFTLAYGKKK
jgi:hypothetical protein